MILNRMIFNRTLILISIIFLSAGLAAQNDEKKPEKRQYNVDGISESDDESYDESDDEIKNGAADKSDKKIERKNTSDDNEKRPADKKYDVNDILNKDIVDDEAEIKEKGAKFKFGGYAKNLFVFTKTDTYADRSGADQAVLLTAVNPLYIYGAFSQKSQRYLASDLLRIRCSPQFEYSDMISAVVDWDNELMFSNYNKSFTFDSYWRPSRYNDVLSMNWEPYYGREAFYRTKINRAYVKINMRKFSATLGRQQIRFGSGRIWNPLDILNPVSPVFVEEAEEQPGTDAVRIDFYPDAKTEVSLVFNPKRHYNRLPSFYFGACNYLARIKTSSESIDFAVLGGYVSKRGTFGFDFDATVLDGKLRGAALCSRGESKKISYNLNSMKVSGSYPKLSFIANIGYEYTFKNGIYLLTEYLFNQDGLNHVLTLKAASYAGEINYISQTSYDESANKPLTANQHYAAIALGKDLHALVRGDLFMIYDFQGRGLFAYPSIKVSLREDLDFNLGVMSAFLFGECDSDFKELKKFPLASASLKYFW